MLPIDVPIFEALTLTALHYYRVLSLCIVSVGIRFGDIANVMHLFHIPSFMAPLNFERMKLPKRSQRLSIPVPSSGLAKAGFLFFFFFFIIGIASVL